MITLSSAPPSTHMNTKHIYCPSLTGLTTRLADASFLMPRTDQNRLVKEAEGHGHWAAAIAADPFGSNSAHFNALKDAGYSGVVNWPSSILLEGQIQQQMSTIPATPATEYAYLGKAQKNGLKTLGFILTPDHAVAAADAGIKDLILHPGILLEFDSAGTAMIRSSLASIITTVKRANTDRSVRLYTSDWHDQAIGLNQIKCDGFVRFQEDTYEPR